MINRLDTKRSERFLYAKSPTLTKWSCKAKVHIVGEYLLALGVLEYFGLILIVFRGQTFLKSDSLCLNFSRTFGSDLKTFEEFFRSLKKKEKSFCDFLRKKQHFYFHDGGRLWGDVRQVHAMSLQLCVFRKYFVKLFFAS